MGYRISKAHIKLGSKIHIEDFIYAKNLFQNSHYALRFGYIVTDYICRNASQWLNQDYKTPLCLVTYGIYSELMASNIQKLTKLSRRELTIYHSLVSDIESGSIEGPSYLKGSRLVLVVPIASTLLTTEKVRLIISEELGTEAHFVNYPLNLIVVGHRRIEDISDQNGVVIDSVAANFWNHIDPQLKIITPKTSSQKQHYFLYVPSFWHLPSECNLCNPKERKHETSLFYTDRASVTPSLIFDFPKGKQINQDSIHRTDEVNNSLRKGLLLKYGHYKRGENHYLYYIDTVELYVQFQDKITEWCEEVRKHLELNLSNFLIARNYIISPAHATNGQFLNTINIQIFNGTAKILYYDIIEDFEENFTTFLFTKMPENAYVFFVDDALCTGNTIAKIQNYVKSRMGGIGISGAFVLLNRLDWATFQLFSKELNKHLYFFSSLESLVMREPDRPCTLCAESKRWENIASSCVLDFTRIKSYQKSINIEIGKMGESEDKGRYGRRLVMSHNIYSAFVTDKTNILRSFSYPDRKGLQELLLVLGFNYNDVEHRINLLKILTQPPFVLYQKIKQKALSWTITEFEDVLTSIKKNGGQNISANYHNLRYAKFLIKRLSAQKASYLIRTDVIKELKELYVIFESLMKKIERDTKSQASQYGKAYSPKDQQKFDFKKDTLSHDQLSHFKKSLNEFNLFYTEAVKEVIWDDEWKSFHLEQSLNDIDGGPLNDASPSYKSLIRMLRLENVTVLQNFLHWICGCIAKHLSLAFKIESYNKDIDSILSLIKNFRYDQHYLSTPIHSYISGSYARDPDFNTLETEEFRNKISPLILLKLFLMKCEENDGSSQETHSWMEYIIWLLCKVIDISPNENGGCYCLTKCGKIITGDDVLDDVSIVALVGENIALHIRDWKESFSYKMIKGFISKEIDFPWANYELIEANGKFYNYSGDIIPLSISESAPHKPEYGHYIYIRLSKIQENHEGFGTFVFFRKKRENLKPVDLRYLLLLRYEFGELVDRTFNNDTYRGWLYEERKKDLILTTQHGFGIELSYLKKIVSRLESGQITQDQFRWQFDIHHKRLANKLPYIKILRAFNEKDVPDVRELIETKGEMKPKKFSVSGFLAKVNKLAKWLYDDEFFEETKILNIELAYDDDMILHFYEDILYDAFFECFHNSKKFCKGSKQNLLISVKNDKTRKECLFSIKDDGFGVEDWQLKLMNERGCLTPTGGLGMINSLWEKLLGIKLNYRSVAQEFFEVNLRIRDNNE